MHNQAKHAPLDNEIIPNGGDIATVVVTPSSDGETRIYADSIVDQLNSEPILPELGFSATHTGDAIELHIPRAESLNARLLEQGITDRRFGDFEGGTIPTEMYVEAMREGVLLVGLDLHDVEGHVASFVKQPPRVIEILKAISAEALASKDPKLMSDAVFLGDMYRGGEPTANKLVQLYKTRMNPLTAVVLAKKDAKLAQRQQLHRAQKSAMKATQSHTLVTSSHTDSDELPIK